MDQAQWVDALEIGVEGKGWSETISPYDRLPASAQGTVPGIVWDLSRSATGMCVHFRTRADQIHVRWQLRDERLGENNFNTCSVSGLDLYGDDRGTWRWVASTNAFEGRRPQVCIAQGLDGVERTYRLYLPLRNPVLKLEVGVPRQAPFEPVQPRKERPIVFYGTSIVHGAYASHAGLVYPSLLGRRLNRPVVNLGFSGSARMEIEIAELLAELDARAYVIDPLANMDLNLIQERAEAFVRRLRHRRPTTPVVLVEDFPRTHAWIRPAVRECDEARCRRFREIFEHLVGEGVPRLAYVEGSRLLGTDGEASIDGVHPGDLGFVRMADVMEPVLAPLCREG
jgi:lysophospholipase L1-like esterase